MIPLRAPIAEYQHAPSSAYKVPHPNSTFKHLLLLVRSAFTQNGYYRMSNKHL